MANKMSFQNMSFAMISFDTISSYVKSSLVNLVEYNKYNRTLTVTFNNGSMYAYDNVPMSKYYGLIDAESVGQYFNERIRNEHKCRKVA